MALTNEHRIICKILTEGDVRPLLDRNVDKDWFVDPEHRDAFRFIMGHFEKYDEVPSRVTFASHMGTTYVVKSIRDSLDYLLDTQAEGLRWGVLRQMLKPVQDCLKDNDTAGAVSQVEEHMLRVHRYLPTPSRIVDSMESSTAKDRWEEYEEREKGGGLLGLSTGFPTIDSTTLGLQSGQLVTVVANAKVGKTTLCLSMANHIYDKHRSPVLFVSFEMGIREMMLRQESLMAGINFKGLQSGTLSRDDRKKYRAHLKKVESDYSWPFHFMDAASGSTVGAVRGQIERLDPAVVFIDGIYMLTDEQTGEVNTPQALTNITRSLKRMASAVGKPVVINTQALGWKMKGTRLSMNSIGYSSSFAQDSDVVLGLERLDDDDPTAAGIRMLKVIASRNSGLAEVELSFDYSTGTLEEFSSAGVV